MNINKTEQAEDELFLKCIILRGKHVTFNTKVDTLFTPSNLITQLQENRRNYFISDLIRMKILLEPILTTTHRNKIWTRLVKFAGDPAFCLPTTNTDV